MQQGAGQHRLAAAGFAQQDQGFAVGQIEIQRMDHGQAPFLPRWADAQRKGHGDAARAHHLGSRPPARWVGGGQRGRLGGGGQQPPAMQGQTLVGGAVQPVFGPPGDNQRDGAVARPIGQPVQQAQAHGGIQPGGGRVGQQNRRADGDGQGEQRRPPQRVRETVGRQVEASGGGGNPHAVERVGHAAQRGAGVQPQVMADDVRRLQGQRALRSHPSALRDQQAATVHMGLSGQRHAGQRQPGQGAQQQGFARARPAGQGEHRARLQPQIGSVDQHAVARQQGQPIGGDGRVGCRRDGEGGGDGGHARASVATPPCGPSAARLSASSATA